MARLIKVMISSRCNDLFCDRTLTQIRRELKTEIEAITVFGQSVFEVWINEDTPAQPPTRDSWEVCIQAVRDCDILIALFNGNAGWAPDDGAIGICHAELMIGLSEAPGKVRLISLGNVPGLEAPGGQRNQRFQAYVQTQNIFRGGTVDSVELLNAQVKGALHDALLTLAQAGVREVSKGRFHSGQALEWSRLDFSNRQRAMCAVLTDAISQREGSINVDGRLIVQLGGSEVVVVRHAIPAAITVASAKEMVGQPFRRDHELGRFLGGDRGGPVHIIACHKTATEAQAMRLLGFPDATMVSAPFGIFVADNIQKVQFAFIVNCRDEATTRHGVQRFFEWLAQTGEDRLVANRARARARIVRTIAEEVGA